MKLPAQQWMEKPGARAILRALRVEDGNCRIVGGAVRDALLGLPVADVDLATRLTPEAVIKRLEAGGVRAVPTGIDHGTVTAVAHGMAIEVTTLRRDVSTDGRRATVAYTDDWREDAARRDFTFNALYADPVDGTIYDYFDGWEDLQARHVRFIGAPLERIAEDHLRILRFFRFHARFGEGAPDAEGLAACAARANDLMALSRERIRDELMKLLGVADPVPTLRLMLDRAILKPVLPEIEPERIAGLERLIRDERAAGVTSSALRRLAALLPRDPALAEAIALRLKLSNAERRHLCQIAESGAGAEPPEVLAYRLGTTAAVDRLLLDGAAIDMVVRIRDWPVPVFPLKGGELVKRGLARGPAVSRLLRAIEQRWIEAGFPQEPERIEALIAETASAEIKA